MRSKVAESPAFTSRGMSSLMYSFTFIVFEYSLIEMISFRDECKAQVNGYSKALFKSFGSLEEANSYLKNADQSPGCNRKRSLVETQVQVSVEESDRLKVFTDGACPSNGRNGARAGIGVHFPDHPEWDISEPLLGRQTNNSAEITAATRAIQEAKRKGFKRIEINTDSNFLKQSVEEWLPNWKRRGWKKKDGMDVINKEDFIQLEKACEGMDVKWVRMIQV